MKRWLSLIGLIRPHFSLPLAGGLAVIVIYLTEGRLAGRVVELTLACASLFLVIAGGYGLNDVCDITADRVNCPGRVLVRGDLSVRWALAWSIALLLAGLVLSLGCRTAYSLSLGVVAAVLVAYDFFSKRMGLLKNLVVSGLLTSLYLLALAWIGPLAGPRVSILWFHPAWLFLSVLGYQMTQDLRDLEGDRAAAAAMGVAFRSRAGYLKGARWAILTGTVFLPWPWIVGLCGWVYAVAVVVAVACALAALRLSVPGILRAVYVEVSVVALGSLLDGWLRLA